MRGWAVGSFSNRLTQVLVASPITAHADLVSTRLWPDQASYGATVYVNLGAFLEILYRTKMKAASYEEHFTAIPVCVYYEEM